MSKFIILANIVIYAVSCLSLAGWFATVLTNSYWVLEQPAQRILCVKQRNPTCVDVGHNRAIAADHGRGRVTRQRTGNLKRYRVILMDIVFAA